MKDSDLQELKPVYIHETSFSANDEISLVDLAMVLVRHKKAVVLTTTLIIALGVITALLKPDSYNFTTSIEIGSQIINGTIQPFESPQTLLAKTQHVFIPHTLNEQRRSQPESTEKFKIKTSVPKNSVIVVLEIKGSESSADIITSLLRSVTQQAIQDHRRIYEAVRKNLVTLIEKTKIELSSLAPERDDLTERRQLLQAKIEVQESQLANLRNTREILPPMKSFEPTGASTNLIIIIAIFTGIFLGVFSAYLAEFSAKIRQKINKENKE